MKYIEIKSLTYDCVIKGYVKLSAVVYFGIINEDRRFKVIGCVNDTTVVFGTVDTMAEAEKYLAWLVAQAEAEQ